MTTFNSSADPNGDSNRMGGYVGSGTMPNTTLDSNTLKRPPSYTQQVPEYYSYPLIYDTSANHDYWQSSKYAGIGSTPPMAQPTTQPTPHPTATSESNNTSRQGSRKRSMKDGGYHEHRKRPRRDPTQENLTPLREVSNHGQHYNAQQYGTQHNPVEIASSPEQQPRKKPYITSSATRHYPESHGDYLREPDPAIEWPIYYAVARGTIPGLYRDWSPARDQVSRYSGGYQKKFKKQADAWAFVNANREHVKRVPSYPNGTTAESSTTQPIPQEHMVDRSLLSPPPAFDTYIHPHSPLIPCSKSIPQSAGTASNAFASEQQQFMGESEQSITEAEQFMRESEQYIWEAESYSIPVTSFVPEPEPKLSAQQKYVVDLIVEGGKNVFYTGSAGCGKSTILKAFVNKLKAKGKRVKIIAPTNLAALNVNGQTTWAFAGWTPDSMKKPLDALKSAAHGKEIWKRFDSTDVLVIDEISMVENLQFERLNEIMKASLGGKRTGPFGGTQVIVTGDVSQLPHAFGKPLIKFPVLPAFSRKAIYLLHWMWMGAYPRRKRQAATTQMREQRLSLRHVARY